MDAGRITSLTNSGKITGTDHAIIENSAPTDTLLTLLPGSDISGKIDLGGGVNTLVVGNGLSIDHLFTGILPQVINSNGAPLFVIGNRVVVVDVSSTLDQQDEQLFDLTNGIWGTVFNNIGDGRNPAATFANGPLQQHSQTDPCRNFPLAQYHPAKQQIAIQPHTCGPTCLVTTAFKMAAPALATILSVLSPG